MSDSRLKKTARLPAAGWFHSSALPVVFGLGLFCICLVTGSSGYGFDSHQKFEKSKKQTLPLKLKALSDKERVEPGETFWLHLMVFLDKGWHMYSLKKQSDDKTVATRIELEALVFDSQDGWQETPPKLVRDEIMEKIMKIHSGQVEFSRLFSVPKNVSPGTYPISGTLHFRGCDNRICTLPQAVKFQTRVIVESGEPG